MELSEAIQGKNISLRNYATGNHKTLCPECSHTRKNKNDPCLSVTIGPAQTSKGPIDAGEFMAHCHNCDWATGYTRPENRPDDYQAKGANAHGSTTRSTPKPEPKRPAFTPSACDSQTVKWFAQRHIAEQTLKRNQVSNKTAWMPGPDKEVNCIAFPYLRNGEVVNIKYRANGKKFRQEKGAEKILYGLDTIGDHKSAVIVEGEIDALSMQEAGLHESMGVLSVPDGAPKQVRDEPPDPEEDTKYSYLWNCREYLDGLETIIITRMPTNPAKHWPKNWRGGWARNAASW